MLIKWSKAGGDEEKLTCGLLLPRMKMKLSAFLAIPLFCSFSSQCLLGAGVGWQRQWCRCVDWTKLATLFLCSFFFVWKALCLCALLCFFLLLFSLGLSLSLLSSLQFLFLFVLWFSFFFRLSFRSASLVLWCLSPCVLCFFLPSQFSSSSVCLYFFLFVPCVFFLFRFVICPLLPPLLLLCWGLSLAFIKPEKVLCPGLQKWRASWRREIVASGRASWV